MQQRNLKNQNSKIPAKRRSNFQAKQDGEPQTKESTTQIYKYSTDGESYNTQLTRAANS